MVAAKLDQSRVLVTKFRQNQSTSKGRSAGQRHTDRQTDSQTNSAENNGPSGLQSGQKSVTHVFAPQMLNSQSSKATVIYSLCCPILCSKCFPLSDSRANDRLTQPLPFFNYAFSKLAIHYSASLVFFPYTLSCTTPHILSGNILSKHCAFHILLLSHKDLTFFHAKSHYRNNVFTDIAITSLIAENLLKSKVNCFQVFIISILSAIKTEIRVEIG